MAAVVPHLPSVRGIAAWISTLVFLVTFTVAVERPGAGALVLVSGLAGVAMQFLASNNGAFVAVVASIAVAGIRLDSRSGRIVAALTGGGFLAASAMSAHPLSPTEAISVIPALLFTYVGSTAVRRLRVEQRRTEELLEEVVAGRDARVRAAALDERTRLAREMHDVLAHTLSALSIQLEGTRMLAEQRSCDPSVTTALTRASGLVREGLGEARRAVGSLRDETLPGPDLLPRLTQEFEHDTGVPCHLQIEGHPVQLSAEARLALYRIAQEALTNVRKHAGASTVDITLHYATDGIELIVDNEGAPLSAPLPGGGYGVSGMRERAELLGGRLEAAPTARGFRVCLWIPTRASSPSAY
jgi:signal transduction histidine kinase